MKEWRVTWNQYWGGGYTPKEVIFSEGSVTYYDPEGEARKFAREVTKIKGDVENKDPRLSVREVTPWEEIPIETEALRSEPEHRTSDS